MTSFPIHTLSDVTSGEPLAAGVKAYFQERLRNKLYAFLVDAFLEEQKKSGFNQKMLAHRLGKGADQINRWLSAPANLTLDSTSDLVLGICGAEVEFACRAFSPAKANYKAPEWLHSNMDIGMVISSNNPGIVELKTNPRFTSVISSQAGDDSQVTVGVY